MRSTDANPRPPKQWRRRYLINPKFQRKVATWLALDVFVVCMAMGTVLYAIEIQHVRDVVLRPSTGFDSSFIMLNALFSLGFAILTAVGMGIGSIVISHRFCGPLYVIGEGLRSITNGRMPLPRKLRKKDELSEFFGLYQDAAAKLRTERRCEIDELDQALNCLKQAAQAGPATAAAIQGAVQHIEGMRDRAESWLGVESAPQPDESSSNTTTTQAPTTVAAS